MQTYPLRKIPQKPAILTVQNEYVVNNILHLFNACADMSICKQ